MKVALVYDRINKFGGAERVLQALHEIWPNAPLYTAVYDQKRAAWAKDFDIRTSWIQNFPFAKKNHEIYPWLMPFGFESFNFDEFDVVISITSAEAKGIITKPHVLHICYCLTPTRYLWSSYDHYINNLHYEGLNTIIKPIIKSVFEKLRKWDLVACNRPDFYIGISKTVSQRIEKYYQKESKIIYPPLDLTKFTPSIPGFHNGKNSKYFLVVSRLVSYKRIEIIIEAFNQLGLNLIIIGTGSEKKFLKKIAKPNIKFIDSQLTDSQLLSYYQNCVALVFAGEEDFGIASLEAQACGKPVIIFRVGGLRETIIEGKTGVSFYPQSMQALINTVRDFIPGKYKSIDCINNAHKYSKDIFINKIKALTEEKWKQFQTMKQK